MAFFQNMLLKMANAKCRNCNYQFRMEDLKDSHQKGELVCPSCQFKLTKNMLGNETRGRFQIDKSNPQPTKNVKVSHTSGGMQLEIRWLSRSSAPIIFLSLFWNFLIGSFIYMYFFSPGQKTSIMTFLPVMAPFVAVGLWLLYKSLCDLLNTTTVFLRLNKLTTRTSPLSFKGERQFSVSEINNLFIERSADGEVNNKKTYKHFVCIQFKNGDIERLCRVQNINEGIYVEKLLEEKMGITDDPTLERIAG